MDFDFLDRSLLTASTEAIRQFKQALEGTRPDPAELKRLAERIRPYPHAKVVEDDFIVAAVDGSGEFPVLQQDDIFVHFVTACGTCFRTETSRQHKMAVHGGAHTLAKQFVVLRDSQKALMEGYEGFVDSLLGKPLRQIVDESDYCEVFGQFGKKLRPSDVTWGSFAFSQASQLATHAYQIRSAAELAMAVRMLTHQPRYVLIDTSLVYFLLGETPYLPELLKRHLITLAQGQGTGIVGLCKSHNLPNGDLLGRHAKEKIGLNDHWYLRLPSAALGEKIPKFLQEKEIPPKLGVSYLFKFEATSFPMRIDVDAAWWQAHLDTDAKELRFFADLDFTCHDVRSYGYPYPMHAAHRGASLTRAERKTLKDLLLQHAQREGILRGSVVQDPEVVHMGGI